jgi:hypothetical protein
MSVSLLLGVVYLISELQLTNDPPFAQPHKRREEFNPEGRK